MAKTPEHRSRTARLILALAVVGLLLAACNLGPNTPTEPANIDLTPLIPEGQAEGQNGEVIPPADGSGEGEVQVPPTNTPVPELLPAETLGPVTVEGTDLRTQEVITIRVNSGLSVSNVVCTWSHQDTGQTAQLGTPTTTAVDANTQQLVYTFTPEAAGTYAISCTGVAATAYGERAVSAAGNSFSVEAKG